MLRRLLAVGADLGVSNLLGLLGVVLVVVASGVLAGFWWAVLLLGLVLIVMAYAAYRDTSAPATAGRDDAPKAAP